jgi:hypothetical protein
MATDTTQFDKLEGIKNQLIKIRDSEAIQNVETDSDVAKGLAGVFGGVGNVLTQSGIASSNGARTSVKNAENVVNPKGNSMMDAMNQLRQENSKLSKAFENEKSTREGIEQTASINEQKAANEAARLAASGASAGAGGGGGTESAGTAGTGTPESTATGAAAGGAAMGGIDTEGDPIAAALAEDFANQQAVVQEQLSALRAFTDAEDSETQQTLNNIQATADLQAKRVAKENQRLAQASQTAGIVSGRGMYSPYEHEGIVSEVIQDGLDRITQIELSAQDAKLVAKKAHREFKYEAFVQATEMVSALSEMKRDTIVAIGKRLQEVEAAERDKMTFDQEQADRTAFILAPELVGATPEEINAAALANNINPGMLMRTVGEYTSEQEALDLDQRLGEEQILTQQNNRANDNARLALSREAALRSSSDSKKDDEKIKTLSIKEVNEFTEAYDLTDENGQSVIGTNWTADDVEAFRKSYPGAPARDMAGLAMNFMAEQTAQDIAIQEMLSDESLDFDNMSYKQKEDELVKRVSENNIGGTVEDKVKKVEAALLEGQGRWFGKGSMAGKAASDPYFGFIPNPDDDALVMRGGTKDAKAWLKGQESRIKELVSEGREVYEIVAVLMGEAGEKDAYNQ